MDRRVLLRNGLSGVLFVLDGCFGLADRVGSNKTLQIRNEYADPVTLDLTIKKGRFPEERTIVFTDEVQVPANETTSLEVLGDDQYRITVTLGDQRHEFGTRPTCTRAYTIITVTYDRQLRSEIQDCE